MSDVAYVVCDDCQLGLAIGKPIRNAAGSIDYCHIGPPDAPPNSARPELTRALWKLVTQHGTHGIRLVSEYTNGIDVIADYREIGGDTFDDIPFDDYLRDWPG